MDLSTQQGRQELGKRIQQAILEAGFPSLTAFAKHLGWSRALIYQYVGGKVLAQLDRLQQVAHATGKPLAWFFAADDAFAERAARLETQLAACRQRLADATAALTEALQRADRAEQSATLARLEAARARCAALRSGYTPAKLLEAAKRWAVLAEDLGDSAQLAAALVQQGHAWLDLGQPAEARAVLQRAVETASSLQNRRLSDAARQELLRALQAMGETAEACSLARELADSRDWWTRWAATVSWAALLEQRGEYNQAADRLAAAEALLEAPDARRDQLPLARAYVLANRVNLLLGRGRYTDATSLARRAASVACEAGARDQELEALLSEGLALVRSGAVVAARESLQRALEWARWAGDARAQILATAFLAELAARTGSPAAAKAHARDAVRLAAETGQRVAGACAAVAAGLAYTASGQLDDAAYWLDHAMRQAHAVDARRFYLEAAAAMARVALAAPSRGRLASALQLAERVAAEARQRDMTDLGAEADLWLLAASLLRGRADPDDAAARAREIEQGCRDVGARWVALLAAALEVAASLRDRSGGSAPNLEDLARRCVTRAGVRPGRGRRNLLRWLDFWPLTAVPAGPRLADE